MKGEKEREGGGASFGTNVSTSVVSGLENDEKTVRPLSQLLPKSQILSAKPCILPLCQNY